MDVHQKAARILDLVFDHAEEHRGLNRTILQRGIEDILLAARAREEWARGVGISSDPNDAVVKDKL